MSELDFHTQVLTKLGELQAEQAETRSDVRAIVDRLDKLNGSVARAHTAIGELELDRARREGEEAVKSTWLSRLAPAIWAVIGITAMMILQHAPSILAATKH